MAGQPGLFDLDERYRALSESGDPLIWLATLIDFEVFRAPLVSALKRSDGTRGGRPSYDPVLMFKVVVLQTLYTLSDDATEFQIRDRLSFMRFLGLGLEHPVPDAKTVWLFREQLTRAGAIEGLFATFDAALKAEGYLAMSGQIVDASIVVCPKQRNTDAEQQAIKAGHIPEGWQDQPKRLAQKDRDARWTLKRARTKATTETTRKRRVEIAIPVRDCHPGVWLQEPRQHRSSLRLRAAVRGHERSSLRRGSAWGGSGHVEHRQPGLGRYGLPLESQRGASGEERLRLEGSLPPPTWVRPHPRAAKGQPSPLAGALGY